MFCDLVGSTNLAMRLDAEDWRNLVNAYLEEASSAVTSFGGHVLKKLGDGLMALFGYPQAEENDAERAVRAALAIQRGLSELSARNTRSGEPELAVRIGIDAGPVVVEPGGEVYGDTPNIASRVQALAAPGSVMVTRVRVRRPACSSQRIAAACAERRARADDALSDRARERRPRFGARALTPLVGREEELDLLRRRWERAARGEGQFVQIVGEPGIGKSRLVAEFRLRLGETPHTWNRVFIVATAAEFAAHRSSNGAVSDLARRRLAKRRLADLENTLRLIGFDAAEYAPLLAPLVDIPLAEERVAKLAPEELRRRQLAALMAWVLAGARSQPVFSRPRTCTGPTRPRSI